jgi:hypothetical protein
VVLHRHRQTAAARGCLYRAEATTAKARGPQRADYGVRRAGGLVLVQAHGGAITAGRPVDAPSWPPLRLVSRARPGGPRRPYASANRRYARPCPPGRRAAGGHIRGCYMSFLISFGPLSLWAAFPETRMPSWRLNVVSVVLAEPVMATLCPGQIRRHATRFETVRLPLTQPSHHQSPIPSGVVQVAMPSR